MCAGLLENLKYLDADVLRNVQRELRGVANGATYVTTSDVADNAADLIAAELTRRENEQADEKAHLFEAGKNLDRVIGWSLSTLGLSEEATGTKVSTEVNFYDEGGDGIYRAAWLLGKYRAEYNESKVTPWVEYHPNPHLDIAQWISNDQVETVKRLAELCSR